MQDSPLNREEKGMDKGDERVECLDYEGNERVECRDCEGGHTPSGWALGKIVQLLMIAREDAAKGKSLHPWLLAVGIESLSPDMAELSSALAGRPASGSGWHDALD